MFRLSKNTSFERERYRSGKQEETRSDGTWTTGTDQWTAEWNVNWTNRTCCWKKDHASAWMAFSTTKKLRLLFEWDGPFKIELRRFDENDNKTEFRLILDVDQTIELLKLLPILVELYRAALLDDEPINVKYCLGKTSFARINYEILCLDMRRFYIRRGETELHPTKKGIALN